MSNLTSYVTPGFGEFMYKNLHYVEAIRVGNTIQLAGQGGWDTKNKEISRDTLPSLIKTDLGEEVDQTFKNIDSVLKAAGGKGFSQVYKLVSYHTDLSTSAEHAARNVKKWFPNHAPIWTEVEVKSLAIPTMHIEIEVEAWDEEGAVKA